MKIQIWSNTVGKGFSGSENKIAKLPVATLQPSVLFGFQHILRPRFQILCFNKSNFTSLFAQVER